ncbi:MAG TPA: hypothetical protein ENF52_03445 [Chloroflexi bacterium]|nr:hypothetical protein [Chloroflexota bacterium]
MPKTLTDAFEELLATLVPLRWDPLYAEAYREDIKDCLTASFDLYAFSMSGAFLHDTAIRGYSYLDYIASLDAENFPDDSHQLLTIIVNVLEERFPGAAVMGHGVVIPQSGDDVRKGIRVVPARLIARTAAGHRVYEVADGEGGWMQASPDAHHAYISTLDSALEGKLKPLIRLLKAWKYFRQVPISSYYLELQTVIYAAKEEMIVYPVDLYHLLDVLWNTQLADLVDQKGIAGRVAARVPRRERKTVLSAIRTGRYHASRALEEASRGDIVEAFRNWNRLFNGHFPAYG